MPYDTESSFRLLKPVALASCLNYGLDGIQILGNLLGWHVI